MSALPYHPDYGLPDEWRLQILRDAQDLGVAEAAAKNGVSAGAIYKWRLAIRETPKKRILVDEHGSKI